MIAFAKTKFLTDFEFSNFDFILLKIPPLLLSRIAADEYMLTLWMWFEVIAEHTKVDIAGRATSLV